MKNVQVTFKYIYYEIKAPIGFKKTTYHISFDVNFELTRKSKYVGGGHLMHVPESFSYYRVVSIYSVRIMVLIV